MFVLFKQHGSGSYVETNTEKYPKLMHLMRCFSFYCAFYWFQCTLRGLATRQQMLCPCLLPLFLWHQVTQFLQVACWIPFVLFWHCCATWPFDLLNMAHIFSSTTLSRPRLVMLLRKALSDVGVDPSGYNGHCFWIGAATTAARMGVNDSLIQTLGKWKYLHLCAT